MLKQYTISVLLLAAFCLNNAKGQVTEDFGFWATVSYNKEVSKRFDVFIEQEFRLQDNCQELGRAFTNIGFDYKLEKWLRFGFNYRFILDRRTSGVYGQRHRMAADAILRHSEKRFTFTYRARLQWEVRGYNYSDKYGFSPSWDMRNRLKVNYRLNRRFEPYLSADVRILLTDARTPYLQGVDRIRLVAGVDWKLSSTKVIDVYFVASEEVQVVKPMRIFAIGIGYNFGSGNPLIGT